MKIINLNNLSHQELVSPISEETYSKSAVLTDHFDFRDIFVHHEILLPRRRSSGPHHHTLREEMIIVLNGSPTCYLGKQKLQMKPGDVVGFKPDLTKSHYIENLSEEIVHLLVICSNPLNDRTVFD